jgi:hypothetical protein
MSEVIQAALITALAPTLVAVTGLLLAWKSLSNKVDKFHAEVNSQMTKALALAEKKGDLQGRSDLIGERDEEAREAAISVAMELAVVQRLTAVIDQAVKEALDAKKKGVRKNNVESTSD